MYYDFLVPELLYNKFKKAFAKSLHGKMLLDSYYADYFVETNKLEVGYLVNLIIVSYLDFEPEFSTKTSGNRGYGADKMAQVRKK